MHCVSGVCSGTLGPAARGVGREGSLRRHGARRWPVSAFLLRSVLLATPVWVEAGGQRSGRRQAAGKEGNVAAEQEISH